MRNALLLLLGSALFVGGWFVLGTTPPASGDEAGGASHTARGIPGWESEPKAETRAVEAVARSAAGRGSRARTAPHLELDSSRGPLEGNIREAGAPRTSLRAPASAPGREPMLFTGRVLPAGSREPVEHALVSLRAGNERSEAETDETGRFRLAWVHGLPGDLVIEHDTFVDLRMAALDPESVGSEPEFRLTPSGVLRGLVTAPPGAELVGSSVDLWRMISKGEKEWPRFEAEVMEDGSFVFLDVEPGEYALSPRAAGLSGRYTAGLVVPVGGEVFVELECAEGGRLDGELVGPPGLALPDLSGATVQLAPRDVGMPKKLARERVLEATVDADGAFELVGVPPGAHRLRIVPPWGGLSSFAIDFDGSGQRIEREFELAPPARLEGDVRDAAGKPVPGAIVRVERRKDTSAVAAVLAGSVEEELAVFTDHEGHFALDPIAAGEALVLVAKREGGPPAWTALAALAPGEERTGIVLSLPDGIELRGRVEEKSATGVVGEHLMGAQVLARYQVDGREFTFASATTNADGEYVLVGLLPGNLRIEARAEGYLEASRKLEFAPGAEPEPVDLQLGRALELSGRVVDEDGGGIANLRVRASAVDPDLPKSQRVALGASAPPARLARTDAFGRFNFAALVPADWFLQPMSGEYELLDSNPRFCDALFAERGGEAELIVRRRTKSESASLDFTVVESETGLVPEGLEVYGAGVGTVITDGGDVVITGLDPKPTRLLLTAKGRASKYVEAELAPGVAGHLGLVQLGPGAIVTIDVKSAKGAAVKDAKVRLLPRSMDAGGPDVGTPVLKLEHIGGGRYRARGVPQASWILKVNASGSANSRTELRVDKAKLLQKIVLESKGVSAGRKGRAR
jgi:protocatechuate 3,4-dioxygenase beta subunit